MTLEELSPYLSNPDKVLDIPLMEKLIDWTTFWIHNLEADIEKQDYLVDLKLDELTEKYGTVAKAEVKLHLEDCYREQKRLNRTLRRIKSYRENTRKKRARIVGH